MNTVKLFIYFYLFIFLFIYWIAYSFVILNPASLHAVISVSGVHRSISLWNLWQVFTRFKLTFVIFEVGNGRNTSSSTRCFIGLEANGIWFKLFLSALTLWRSCSKITASAWFWHCILKKHFDLSIWTYYMPHISNIYY